MKRRLLEEPGTCVIVFLHPDDRVQIVAAVLAQLKANDDHRNPNPSIKPGARRIVRAIRASYGPSERKEEDA